ncbi:hypothetical protein CYMTET_20986 [Cymbomonas tetramitiformis]|uniref:Uncharacterized protein n=1 Tax=Cymbomonas tetramitiformis TaxID=36881 RepID=A0AAE0G479_9CHLO|nr:hypothetical protein CYMTET_20986 [Cymbomonas tetramitiformis]
MQRAFGKRDSGARAQPAARRRTAVHLCQNVNVYGFDPPDEVFNNDMPGTAARPYRYFDSTAPPDTLALHGEHLVLQALHARRFITICSTEHAVRCVQMTPRNANGLIMRSGIKWL